MDNQKSVPRTSKRRTVLKALAGAGIAGSGLVSVTGAASARQYDWEVDSNGGKDFETIQAAVNRATAGDTIKVWEGEYKEQVEFYGWHEGGGLTIIGDPGDPDTVGPGANAPKLIGNIDESKTAAGFRLGERSGITIKGFEISDFHQDWWGTGIKGGKSNIKLTDNEIHSMSTRGIAVWEGDELEETEFVIKRNNVYDVGNDGIVLGNHLNSIVKANRVEGAGFFGIHFPNSNKDLQDGVIRKVNVRKNDICNNKYGMFIADSIQANEFEVHQNNIMDNEEFGLLNGGKGSLSAEKNYWGSPTGPKRKNPAGKFIGKGEKIIGEIDVTPWEPKEI